MRSRLRSGHVTYAGAKMLAVRSVTALGAPVLRCRTSDCSRVLSRPYSVRFKHKRRSSGTNRRTGNPLLLLKICILKKEETMSNGYATEDLEAILESLESDESDESD